MDHGIAQRRWRRSGGDPGSDRRTRARPRAGAAASRASPPRSAADLRPSVVARRQPLRPLPVAQGRQLLGRLVAGIGVPGLAQPREGRRVAGRPARSGAGSASQPSPSQLRSSWIAWSNTGCDRSRSVSSMRRTKLAAFVPREQPVHDRDARIAQVEKAGRAGREPDHGLDHRSLTSGRSAAAGKLSRSSIRPAARRRTRRRRRRSGRGAAGRPGSARHRRWWRRSRAGRAGTARRSRAGCGPSGSGTGRCRRAWPPAWRRPRPPGARCRPGSGRRRGARR